MGGGVGIGEDDWVTRWGAGGGLAAAWAGGGRWDWRRSQQGCKLGWEWNGCSRTASRRVPDRIGSTVPGVQGYFDLGRMWPFDYSYFGS